MNGPGSNSRARPLVGSDRSSALGLRVVALAIAALAAAGCGDGVREPGDAPSAGADSAADQLGADQLGGDALTEDGLAGDSAPQACSSDAQCPTSTTACVVGRCISQGTAGYCAWVLEPDGAPCDDGQACTAGERCTAGKCAQGKDVCGCSGDSDCAAQDDGNLCNGTLYCDLTGPKGVCKPNFKTVVNCPASSDPCQLSTCVTSTGACATVALDSTAAQPLFCEDGNPCTANDSCLAGKCTAGQQICECLGDKDCADDGNLCNGTPYCDKGAFPFTCKVNPATVVTCPTGLDTACEKHVCVPSSGACAVVLSADGTPCDDGEPCSSGDFCAGGACKPGKNICPCASNADCAAHEDGDLCNGTLYCDLAAAISGCKLNPATVVSCPSGNDTACHKNICDAKDGKCKTVLSSETTVCDDANLCTQGDHCQQGACVGGANTCKCEADGDCKAFEDGDLCNGTLYCNKSKPPFVCEVNPATVVNCSDGNDTACSKNTCDPKKGKCAMIAEPDGSSCDADDFACTQGDACKAGLCLAGVNVCKCEQGTDCEAFEDGNVCNGALYCDKTHQPFVCKVNPATLIVCPSVDDTACLHNLCQPTTGKCQFSPVHQGQACDGDGDPCTSGDACNLGECEIGPNTCQCQGDADCGKFDDGNLCNGTLYCDKAAAPFLCKPNPATVITCPSDKNTACDKNLCQPKTGQCQMVTQKDGAPCNDGNPCSIGDACSAGQCSGANVCACSQDEDCAAFDDGDLCNGTMACDTAVLPHTCVPTATPVVCPPAGVACQKSVCVASTGLCVGAADLAQDGTACDDGDACTSSSKCESGSCSGGQLKGCDDANPCSLDSCAAGSCVHLALTGTACDDGDACTSGDKCGPNQLCKGTPIGCDDANPCTDDSCDEAAGCQFAANSAACNDGNLCTAGDSCVASLCKGTLKSCDDGNACSQDACNPMSGQCTFAATPGSCDDGNLCTVKDACSGGACLGQPLTCSDGLACTLDSCAPSSGCGFVALPTGATCDDANPCTHSDLCAGGACKGTADCSDGNPCTDDSCTAKGCVSLPAALPGPCDDGNLCTEKDFCKDGSCQGLALQCPSTCGPAAQCSPQKGCPSATASCDDGNACTLDSCVDGVGCTALPSSDGAPCSSTNKGQCVAGLCSDCTSVQAFVAVAGHDVSLTGLVRDDSGDIFAVGSAAKTKDGRRGLFARLLGGTGLQPVAVLGDTGDSAFAGVLPTSNSTLLAVGHKANTAQGKVSDGWLVQFKKDSSVDYDLALSRSGEDGFLGVLPRPSGPAAFGFSGAKGWVAEIKANGAVGTERFHAQTGQALRWTAGHTSTTSNSGTVYLTGTATDAGGIVRAAVIALDSKDLSTQWLKVFGVAGQTPTAVVVGVAGSAGATVTVGGYRAGTAAIEAWLAVFNAAGVLQYESTEAAKGGRGYLAAIPDATGQLVLVGGAFGAPPKPVALAEFAWFATWDAAAKKQLVGQALARADEQLLRAVAPMGSGFLVAGDVVATGQNRRGWIIQVDAKGAIVCGP